MIIIKFLSLLLIWNKFKLGILNKYKNYWKNHDEFQLFQINN